LRFPITSPPSGCEGDFHPQAVIHARRTKEGPRHSRSPDKRNGLEPGPTRALTTRCAPFQCACVRSLTPRERARSVCGHAHGDLRHALRPQPHDDGLLRCDAWLLQDALLSTFEFSLLGSQTPEENHRTVNITLTTAKRKIHEKTSRPTTFRARTRHCRHYFASSLNTFSAKKFSTLA